MKTLLIVLSLMAGAFSAPVRANVIDNWVILSGTPNKGCSFMCGDLMGGTFSYDVTAGQFVNYDLNDTINYGFTPLNSTCLQGQCDNTKMVVYNAKTNTTLDVNSPEWMKSQGQGDNQYWGWVGNGQYPNFDGIDRYQSPPLKDGNVIIELVSVDVPEPGTMLLILLGTAVLFIYRRRNN